MSQDLDLDRQLEKDRDRIKGLLRRDRSGPDFGAAIEGALWALSLLCVGGMVLTLPWVGEGKPISGELWLGGSLAGILLFGALAGAVHWVRQHGADVDRQMSRRYDTRR